MFCCFILVHSFLNAKISHEPHPIKFTLVHLLVNLNSTASVPSKTAKNVGAEVHCPCQVQKCPVLHLGPLFSPPPSAKMPGSALGTTVQPPAKCKNARFCTWDHCSAPRQVQKWRYLHLEPQKAGPLGLKHGNRKKHLRKF